MNRKNLTAAVLAGLAGVVGIAGSAQAVNINPDGTGQVLLYPYYTTNGDNVTLLSVVNTSEDAKAVKVRFMESENSMEVLDFNLYMSAYDVWVAAISSMPADAMYDDCDPNLSDDEAVYCEGPLLTIPEAETTCTVPYLYGAQPFLPFAYSTDKGSQDQSRMNQGHFEMIEMGELIYGIPTKDDLTLGWAARAATHTSHDVVDDEGEVIGKEWKPADCDALNLAWTASQTNPLAGRWLDDPTDGVSAPSGGLFGGASIVSVQEGAMHTYDALAINGWNLSGFEFDASGLGGDTIHAVPGTTKPDLNSGDQVNGLVFNFDGMVLDSGALVAPIDAVSYVLQHDQMMNEYVTEIAVAARTEWVVTFPTKRWYVNTVFPDPAVRPFTTRWAQTEFDTSGTLPKPIGLATACEQVTLDLLWDREERFEDLDCTDFGNCEAPPVVSPPRPGTPDTPAVPFELCYETNVIRFGGARIDGPTPKEDGDLPMETEILGAPSGQYTNIDNDALGFENGWARFQLDTYLDQDCSGGTCVSTDATREPIGVDPMTQLNGLPVVGFAVTRFSNGFLGENANVLSSYGGLFQHKTSRKIGSDDPSAPPPTAP